MTHHKPKIAVVGAGITGLAAAFYLQKRLIEQHTPAEVTVIEMQDRPGGKVQTMLQEGFVIERGPDSFLARKPEMVELVQDLGLEHELTGLNPNVGSASILHQGKFHAIPRGFVMGIPTQLRPFLETRLISLPGKIRASLDLLLPGGRGGDDEPLGEFLERRLGKEVVTQVAEPLLSGIYAGDLYGLSTKATFPQFLTLQRKHRSLILGMRQSQGGTKQPHPAIPPTLKKSAFLHLRSGLSSIIDALSDRLPQGQLLLNTEVTSLQKQENGYRLLLNETNELDVDAVIFAIPPYQTAKLLSGYSVSERLNQIHHASVANVVFGYYRKPEADYRGTGFLIPRNEGKLMTACTFTSDKWSHTAPESSALIRCYVGRAGQEDWMKQSDEEISEAVFAELNELIGLSKKPDFYKVTRWNRAMPQYTPGHDDRLEAIRTDLHRECQGIYLAGAGYGGVGLPDCVRQGKEAADQAAEYLKKAKK